LEGGVGGSFYFILKESIQMGELGCKFIDLCIEGVSLLVSGVVLLFEGGDVLLEQLGFLVHGQ